MKEEGYFKLTRVDFKLLRSIIIRILAQMFRCINICSTVLYLSLHFESRSKVPSLKEVNFGKVKLWAVEHFWTDFDLIKRRDKKMDQVSSTP